MKFISYQANDKDCGFHALKMLLATLAKNKDYLNLEKPKDKLTDFSFMDLKTIAAKYGVKLQGYLDEDKFIGHTMKLPLIALLDDEGRHYRNHAVVITKVTETRVHYLDPKEGACSMRISEFGNYYTGHILEVEENNIMDFKKKSKEFISAGNWVVLLGTSILAVSFLLVGSFFLKEDSFILLPFMFIVLYSLSELLEKWFLLHLMKKFDNENFEYYVGYGSRAGRMNRVKKYYAFRKMYFNIPHSLVASLLIIVAISFILAINSLVNAFAIVIVILLGLIDAYTRHKSKEIKDIEADEKELDIDLDDEQEYAFEMHSLADRSNKVAFSFSIQDCFIKFIILALSFALMLYSKTISSNFVIFHFFILSYLYDNLKKVLEYDKENTKYLKEKAQFEEIILVNKKKAVL